MAWVDIHTVLECRVDVVYDGSIVPPESYSEVGIDSVTVIDGVVHVFGSEEGLSSCLYVVVTPLEAVDAPVRVANFNVSFDGAGNNCGAIITSIGEYGFENDEQHNLTQNGYPEAHFTPDPLEFETPLAQGLYVGVRYGSCG